MTEAIRAFLNRERPPTPCLVVDLDTVRTNYLTVRAVLPADVLYAVKANPAPEIIRLLASLGSGFDVASIGEIELCLAQGISADRLSYGNTIKKASDIASAYRFGVRRFSFDSPGDLANLAQFAPGSVVACRFLVDAPESATAFGHKFGCTVGEAVGLLERAAGLGLRPAVCFHVGSQQLDPSAWSAGVTQAVGIVESLASKGIVVESINLGGGFPASYRELAPPLSECAAAIRETLGDDHPPLFVEPGRAIVATAGMIRAEVVSVVDRDRRWVYLDVGRYNGLAETENEYIVYDIRPMPSIVYDASSIVYDARCASTSYTMDDEQEVVLAGPTCDGDDVIYQHTPYSLPRALRAGDRVDIHHAGAYTASYSSVAFNGIPPLATYFVGGQAVGAFAGRHVLAELHGIEPGVLNNVDFLREALERALKQAGATVCEVTSKRFEPQGVTVLALLAESHASVHTYPERGSAFVDVFTCGQRADPNHAVRVLSELLEATRTSAQTVHRGQS